MSPACFLNKKYNNYEYKKVIYEGEQRDIIKIDEFIKKLFKIKDNECKYTNRIAI